MSIAFNALAAASGYLRRNPSEVKRAFKNIVELRAGIPVDALRWLLDQAAAGGKLRDPRLDEVPPGLRLTASVDLMNTPVRASATVFIDRVTLDPKAIEMSVRLEDIDIDVLGDASTPVAALLKSGALDLSQPGNLAKHMDLPPVIVEALDNRLTIDLMKEPRIADNAVIRQALAVVTPLLTMRSIETEDAHLNVAFAALPKGLRGAASALREGVFRPGVARVHRHLLPERFFPGRRRRL